MVRCWADSMHAAAHACTACPAMRCSQRARACLTPCILRWTLPYPARVQGRVTSNCNTVLSFFWWVCSRFQPPGPGISPRATPAPPPALPPARPATPSPAAPPCACRPQGGLGAAGILPAEHCGGRRCRRRAHLPLLDVGAGRRRRGAGRVPVQPGVQRDQGAAAGARALGSSCCCEWWQARRAGPTRGAPCARRARTLPAGTRTWRVLVSTSGPTCSWPLPGTPCTAPCASSGATGLSLLSGCPPSGWPRRRPPRPRTRQRLPLSPLTGPRCARPSSPRRWSQWRAPVWVSLACRCARSFHACPWHSLQRRSHLAAHAVRPAPQTAALGGVAALQSSCSTEGFTISRDLVRRPAARVPCLLAALGQ